MCVCFAFKLISCSWAVCEFCVLLGTLNMSKRYLAQSPSIIQQLEPSDVTQSLCILHKEPFRMPHK